MKSLQSILSSPSITVKLEASSVFQLDNPISIKKQAKANGTKNILRKRSSNRVKPSPELVDCLQKAAQVYQDSASTRYLEWIGSFQKYTKLLRSDVQLLKSDFHGVEMEVYKAKCFSFVGLKGIVIKETFSTFVMVDMKTKSKSFSKLFELNYFALIFPFSCS